ncbi:hypothetical protein MKQ68_19870 [Chitinophaga horti]|uniref:Phosphoribosylpyrophosphate synthetase n=1 Tax=Chitinophaga horti TaxID=2920382 RepID=A0ABY6IY89_9BACT|nr:hypothetical protein [Chitinophaga horti]UYQ92345.1 hypothetical protein MKQ68_19870 [Chitinophaga horti]
MEQPLHYDTVVNAINALRQQGFTIDFNIEDACIVNGNSKIDINDIAIVDVFRYEGNSDPSDEAAVYALETKDGKRGVLVTGYGASAVDGAAAALLSQLPRK